VNDNEAVFSLSLVVPHSIVSQGHITAEAGVLSLLSDLFGLRP
jgi:hypothetical protein